MTDQSESTWGDCPSQETLQRVCQARANQRETAGVVAHLAACPQCRRRLDQWTLLPPELDRLRSTQLTQIDADREPNCGPGTVRLPPGKSRGEFPAWAGELGLDPPGEPPFVASLGRFQIVGPVGRGGMGIVLEGFDPVLRRAVAIKVMKPALAADRRLRDSLLVEARSAAQLQHPHVVIVYDVCSDREPPFLVMEYIRGISLAALIRAEGKLPAARAVRLCIEILSALNYAHGLGLIHRDVKPGNVLLDARIDIAKLADFGLARKIADPLAGVETTGVVGTPCYMSPEQASAVPACDGRCDLFSVGVILFEMVTGQLPFPGSSVREILDAVRQRPAPDPRRIEPQVPESLARIVDRALQKKPDQRYPSAAAFTEDLQEFLDQHGRADPAATWPDSPAAAASPQPGALQAMLELTQPQAPFRARVWIDRQVFRHTRDIVTVPRDSRDCCRVGDRFTLNVQAAVDCYVTLIDVGTSGNVFLLLQNLPLRAGAPVTLCGPDEQQEWVVGEPPGIEQVKALFTRQPLQLFPQTAAFAPLAPSGNTRDIVTRIKQAGRRLQDMPADSWTDATCRFLVEEA